MYTSTIIYLALAPGLLDNARFPAWGRTRILKNFFVSQPLGWVYVYRSALGLGQYDAWYHPQRMTQDDVRLAAGNRGIQDVMEEARRTARRRNEYFEIINRHIRTPEGEVIISAYALNNGDTMGSIHHSQRDTYWVKTPHGYAVELFASTFFYERGCSIGHTQARDREVYAGLSRGGTAW